MIKVYQEGREVASFPTTYATAKALGCVYTTVHSRLVSGKPYNGLTFKNVDKPILRIVILKNGERVHTGYGLEHASELTGLSAGKIQIMIETGEEYDGWSFDEDDEPQFPKVIVHNGVTYNRIYNGYRNSKSKMYLHRVIAREQYGEIPQRKRVWFRDGNRFNCDKDNIYLTE